MRLLFAFTAALFVATEALGAAPVVRVVPTPDRGDVPDAEVDRNGAIHVAFVKGENAYYAKSDDGGASFSQPLRINSAPDTVHPPNMFRGPDLAVGKDGRVHVIWYVNAYQRKRPHEEWGVFYSHLNPGETAFAPEVNLNRKPSDNFSLASDGAGHVAVVWMAGKLFLAESSDGGESFRTRDIAMADPCECCASRASFSPGGRLMIAYREKKDNFRDMYLITRLKRDGDFQMQRLSSTPWRIDACPMTGTFLSKQGTQEVAAWETMGSIYYARLGAGNSTGKEIKAANRGKWPIALVSAEGTVIVSWKTGSPLSWQEFNANDKPKGEAAAQPSANPHRHAGVIDKNGVFVLID